MDDIEGMVSVERHLQSCGAKALAVVGPRHFEPGLEAISELGHPFSIENNANLHFIGQYDVVVGGDKEYEILMNDSAFLPNNFKDVFSKLGLKLEDGELQLTITHFFKTKRKVSASPGLQR